MSPRHQPTFTRRQQRALISVGILIISLIIVMIRTLSQSPDNLPLPSSTSLDRQLNQTITVATNPVRKLPDWLDIYFTNPNPPDDTQNGIDRYVVAALDKAQISIDLASFDLNLPSVVEALINASQRGVMVRVVYDGENGETELDASRSPDNKPYNALQLLKKVKTMKLVDGGRSNGLMHDKIIIVDSKTLFVGSWNASYNDTFRNNNHLLKITSRQIIANYQAKFNEMAEDKRFGAQSKVGALKPALTVGKVQVENYFSPVDEVMAKLVGYVQSAQKSVYFMAFTYTHKDLANAMIERFKSGVDVQGVIENRGASQGALVPLFCAKLPVKVDGNPYTMHHKTIIIDDEIVITGSYNFTLSADTANDDNLLVIHDPSVAALYLEEFNRVMSLAKDPDPAEIQCSK